MLKALKGKIVYWLTRVSQVACKLGKTPKEWQTDVIIPICKKDNFKYSMNYQRISLLIPPEKVPGKEMPRNNVIKVGRWPVWFLSWAQRYGLNFHSVANL